MFRHEKVFAMEKKPYRRPEIIQHKVFEFSHSKFRHSNHRIDAHTRANHTVPYGTALLGRRCPRHFVPGYDRTVPPGHFGRRISNFPGYKSITTSPLGWEQQISRLPCAGGSSGSGW